MIFAGAELGAAIYCTAGTAYPGPHDQLVSSASRPVVARMQIQGIPDAAVRDTLARYSAYKICGLGIVRQWPGYERDGDISGLSKACDKFGARLSRHGSR